MRFVFSVVLMTFAFASAAYSYNPYAYPIAQSELRAFYQVSPGVYRGGRPTSQADFSALRGLGIRTLIDIDDMGFYKDREIRLARENAMNYYRVPTSWAWKIPHSSVEQILYLMTHPALQPVYIHCQLGYDRTGIIAAIYRVMVQGWTTRQALDELNQIGYKDFLIPLKWTFYSETRGYR